MSQHILNTVCQGRRKETPHLWRGRWLAISGLLDDLAKIIVLNDGLPTPFQAAQKVLPVLKLVIKVGVQRARRALLLKCGFSYSNWDRSCADHNRTP